MSTNAKRAVLRIKDKMRQGALLMRSHTTNGKKWFLLSRSPKVVGREIEDHIATLVISEVDVFPRRDGMWPGYDQTYGIGDP